MVKFVEVLGYMVEVEMGSRKSVLASGARYVYTDFDLGVDVYEDRSTGDLIGVPVQSFAQLVKYLTIACREFSDYSHN